VSRRRRAVLLLGLALLLGGLAFSDVSGREARLKRAVGPAVPVVVARHDLAPRARIARADLAVRRVPARWAPAGAASDPRALVGLRTAGPVEAGADLTAAALDDGSGETSGAPVRRGERVADVVASATPELVVPGGRVDVLVTTEPRDGSRGRTFLALQDVEVLASRTVDATSSADERTARVAASLRVTLRQAVFLAAAQGFARELRLLPRAAGDRAHAGAALAVGADLR
jgi:pilus assembly protein CpaB